MASYSKTERVVAKLLESTPWLRDLIRWSYKRVLFVKHKRRGFTYSLHSDYLIKSPYDLIGEKMPENEVLFFGYYDKSPWNSSMTKMVFHSLNSSNEIEIKAFDLNNRKSYVIGKSETWNYQQGAMVQWIDDNKVVYNDKLASGVLGSKVVDVISNDMVEFPMPVQCVNPDGRSAISLNYSRLMWLRPDYGYRQKFMNFKKDMSFEKDGLWLIDFSNGNIELIITLKQLVGIENAAEMGKSNHKVNHVMYSPDGKNIVFMHRWIGPKENGQGYIAIILSRKN